MKTLPSAYTNIGAVGLALDETYAYFTIGVNDTGAVLRAPLAGGSATTLYTSATMAADSIAVTPSALYWTQSDALGLAQSGFQSTPSCACN